MHRACFLRRLSAWLLAAACLLASGSPALARMVSEPAVKAGFVFNFAKFTQWPHSRDKLLVCTTVPQELDGQLALLRERQVGQRTIEVRQGVQATEWRNCDLLYLSAGDASRIDAVLLAVADAPVLTVGDFPGFTGAGGMIGLYLEDGKMRFDINLRSTERARLMLNSQMVKLAGRVLR